MQYLKSAHAGIVIGTGVIMELYPDDNPWSPCKGFSIIVPTHIIPVVIEAIANEIPYKYSYGECSIIVGKMVMFSCENNTKSIYPECVRHLFMYAWRILQPRIGQIPGV